MPSFEIPDVPAAIKLKPQVAGGQTTYAGPAMFSVTNKSGQQIAGRLSMEPQGNAKADWFEILGEKERPFAGSETQKITVNVKTPPATTPGDYKARFRVVNVADPDNDYTESAVVTFNVPAAEAAKGGIPWWVWLIVGGVALLIVAGIVIWLLLPPSKATVPNVSAGDMTYAQAADQVTANALKPVEVDTTVRHRTPGNVIAQDPAAGTSVDKNSEVRLTVAQAAAKVEVPDVSSQGYSYDHAEGILEAKGFTASKQAVAAQGKPPGTVVAQNPAAGAQVPAAQKAVALSVDPGVAVPDVSSTMSLGFQTAYNKLHAVGLGIGSQSCKLDPVHADVIVGQAVTAGTAVAKGTDIGVTIGQKNCIVFIPKLITRINPGLVFSRHP